MLVPPIAIMLLCPLPEALIQDSAATSCSGTIWVSEAKSTGRQTSATTVVIRALPFRPLFLDFNAVYAPKLATHTYLELVGGIGALDTRIYCQGCGNGYNTNYASDKHFMADLGAGLKFYPKGGFFIRPEARLYLVNNNLNIQFAANRTLWPFDRLHLWKSIASRKFTIWAGRRTCVLQNGGKLVLRHAETHRQANL